MTDERKQGRSKLVYNKATRTIDKVDSHPQPMTDNALKPCPMSGHIDSVDNAVQESAIVCRTGTSPSGFKNCSIVECCCGVNSGWHQTREQSIAAWNTRAAPTQPASDQVERLKEAIYEIANASGSFAGTPDYQDAVYWRAEVAALMAEHGLTWEQASIRRQAAIAAMRDTKDEGGA